VRTITEYLKNSDARICVDHFTWIVWDQGEWVVFQRPYNKKNTRTLLRTKIEERLVRWLEEYERDES
jgi:hypothetical protein